MVDYSKYSLLILDCNDEYLSRSKIYLVQKGYAVFTSSTLEEYMTLLKEHSFDLVLFDWGFSNSFSDRIDGLKAIQNKSNDLAVIITTLANERPDLKNMNFSALEYLRKPFPIWELFSRVSNIIQALELRKELEKALYELITLKEGDNRVVTT